MTQRPKSWPRDVAPVSIEEVEKLGINPQNELFWDGRRVLTRRQFALTVPQSILAILAALASIATIATGLNNASVFLCARGHDWLGCPAAIPAAATSPAGPAALPRP